MAAPAEDDDDDDDLTSSSSSSSSRSSPTQLASMSSPPMEDTETSVSEMMDVSVGPRESIDGLRRVVAMADADGGLGKLPRPSWPGKTWDLEAGLGVCCCCTWRREAGEGKMMENPPSRVDDDDEASTTGSTRPRPAGGEATTASWESDESESPSEAAAQDGRWWARG